ncbi:MAG: sensor domain-containing diguanylate cyclase [Gammaproteobacteria bacterium]|nr:sensor domain-containing diguanylate cyclase [Gammaproteobacteria bacterium]
MKTPDTPANEKERLKTLRSTDILDTDPEERFDRLTRMAQRVFGVSIALVSLVDENRQWFKSKAGLDACETGRDISFCGHAILGNDIFIIEDALEDERFADNPLVTGEPKIRFYAGAPLRYLDGNKLGTLCIIDQKPRTMQEEDCTMLRDLAEMAEGELSAIQLATIDDLTKISNRRGFISLAQNSINLCARQGTPVSMVFLDLDKFKPINDQFGHAEGDHALVMFAELMRKSFRDSDVFARIGGDEFVVLLTNTEKDHAAEIVARFRGQVEAYSAKAKRGYDLCFSDGIVSMLPDQDSLVDDLLREADVLMYEKKLDNPQPVKMAKQA